MISCYVNGAAIYVVVIMVLFCINAYCM